MNKAVFVLLATTLVASSVCLHLVRELRNERERSAALQVRVADLETTRTSTFARVTPFSPGIPETSSVDEPAKAASTPPPQTVQTTEPAISEPALSSSLPHAIEDPRERMRQHFEEQRKLLQDPQYREAMRAQHRLHFESSFPDLASELGLTQEHASQLFDMLADHQLREMEQARMPEGEVPWQQAMQQAEMRQKERQAEIEALIGTDKYQKWQEYQQTLGQRHRVASLQSALALAGAPLDAQQSKALLNALVEDQKAQRNEFAAPTAVSGFAPYPNGFASNQEEQLQKRERAHARMVESLKPTLSTQQIAHLKSVFDREIQMQRVHLKMRRAQGEEGSDNVYFDSGGFGSTAIAVAPE